jgi:hypothetical protein
MAGCVYVWRVVEDNVGRKHEGKQSNTCKLTELVQ